MITRKNDSDITIEMIECAKTRLNDLYTISSKKQVFHYLASLNLLNSAIKNPAFKGQIRYQEFKPKAAELFTFILRNNMNLIDEVYYSLSESCLYVRCFGLQFSFHRTGIDSKIMKNFIYSDANESVAWDGIRLQQIAAQLFQFAEANQDLDNNTFRIQIKNIIDNVEALQREVDA